MIHVHCSVRVRSASFSVCFYLAEQTTRAFQTFFDTLLFDRFILLHIQPCRSRLFVHTGYAEIPGCDSTGQTIVSTFDIGSKVSISIGGSQYDLKKLVAFLFCITNETWKLVETFQMCNNLQSITLVNEELLTFPVSWVSLEMRE